MVSAALPPWLLPSCHAQDSFYKSLTAEDRANIKGGWAEPRAGWEGEG